MRLLANGFFSLIALTPLAASGEVQVRVIGEVIVNLSNSAPFWSVTKGSQVVCAFRVQTPGTAIVVGQEQRYAIVPSSLTVSFIGIAPTTFGAPTRLTIEDDAAGVDRFRLWGNPNATQRLTMRVDNPASLIHTPHVEDLTGVHDIGTQATISQGMASGPGAFLEIRWHTVRIDPLLAGPTFCDPAEPNSTGYATILAGWWTGPAGGLHLEGESGPPQQFGYFLVASGTQIPGTQISQGRLCLSSSGGQQLGRYATPGTPSLGQFSVTGILQNLSGTSASGSGFDVPSVLPLAGAPLITPGETWHFQLWHREPNGQANFSNGLSVTF